MPRRVLEGKVVSDKMDKTITVLVERNFMHPKYKKYIKRTAKYAAHDEANSAKEGDVVQIMECSPISKRKTWTLVGGAERGSMKKQKPKAVAKKPAVKKAEPKAEKKETEKKAPAKKAAAKKTTKKTEKK
jgi:small subunit ribosomal protein S17